MLTTIKDIWYRLQNKQRCLMFGNDYIDTEILDQYRKIFNNYIILSKTDVDGNITHVNDKFMDTFGFTKDFCLQNTHNIIRCKEAPQKMYRRMWSTILHGNPFRGNFSCSNDNGDLVWNDVNIFPIFDRHHRIFEFVALRNDITEVVGLRRDITQSQEEMIITLGSLIEGKDPELKQHVYRVAEYSYILAKAYGLSSAECEIIKNASPIHDAGKVTISDGILHKPGKLTEAEMKIMKTHTTAGFDLFKDSSLDLLKASAIIAHQHHERWDGSGYPRELKGKEIHIYGRIVSLCDVYDALSMKRTYKEPWNVEDIEAYITQQSGKMFEPELVELFFKHKEKFRKILKETYV